MTTNTTQANETTQTMSLTTEEAAWAEAIRQALAGAPAPKFQPGDIVTMLSAYLRQKCKAVVVGINYNTYSGQQRRWEYFVQPLLLEPPDDEPSNKPNDEPVYPTLVEEENVWEAKPQLFERADLTPSPPFPYPTANVPSG